MNISPNTMLEGFILLAQIGLAVIGWRVRSEMAELRSHIYEHFLTKADFYKLWRNDR